MGPRGVIGIVLVRDDGLYWSGAYRFTASIDDAERLDDEKAANLLAALRVIYPKRSFLCRFVGKK